MIERELPALSLVIAATDQARHLSALFASLRAQFMNFEQIEIVFVDNASGDGSLEIARAWGEALEHFQSARLEQRVGRRQAMAAGRAMASAGVVLCIEGDCFMTRSLFDECMDALRGGCDDVVLTGYAWCRPGALCDVRFGESPATAGPIA